LKESRLRYQLSGFINTPSLFLNNLYTGIQPFHLIPDTNLEIREILSKIEFPVKLVMGKRMEFFFKAAIIFNPQLQLLANNIQIHQNKITLGELDYLVNDLQSQKILHIELMYKIYVYDPNIQTEMKRWIGPNRKDSLIEKLDKVKNKQLPLLYSIPARPFLKTLEISAENIEQQICYKAKLFIPKHLEGQDFPYVNNKCIAGYYYNLQQFIEEFQDNDQFYAPEKQDWPSHPESNTNWVSYKKIIKEIRIIHLKKKAPLIWIQKNSGEYESTLVVWW
tara:strand:- start:280 stop:1113 length:834 start_codon:yes stop_codon:yes gene_type:complete